MSKNAYFHYMVEFKKREEQRSGRALNMGEVSTMASPSWNLMSEAEKQPFKEMAKRRSGNPGLAQRTIEKYTSQGIPVSAIEREANAKIKAQQEMESRIARLLRYYTVTEAFGSHPIYFMSGNYFYKTSTKFVPAELAIVKFSFKDGIIRRYHMFLNPGRIELGFACDAKMYSEETHHLPLPPDAFGESDFTKVQQKVMEVLTDDANGAFDGGKPIVYTYTGDLDTEEDNIQMLRSFMSQFSKGSNPIDIFPLTRLFVAMKKELARKGRGDELPNDSVANICLSNDPYETRAGLSCSYHEEVDASKYCALSKAVRWVYIMADHMCVPMGINLIAGKQLPANVDLAPIPSSVCSFRSDSEEEASRSEVFSEIPSDSSTVYEPSPSVVRIPDRQSILSSRTGSRITHRSGMAYVGPQINECTESTIASTSYDEDIEKRTVRPRVPIRRTFKIDNLKN